MKHIINFSFVCFLFFLSAPLSEVVADQWFDSYGAISWTEERLHLDNFAIYLKRNSEMIGYIGVCSNNHKFSVKNQKGKMNKIEKYLVGVRKVEASRIKIIDRGKCIETNTILQPIDQKLGARTFPGSEAGK